MVKGVSSGNLNIFCYVPVMKDFVLGWARVYAEDKCPGNQEDKVCEELFFGTNRRYSWQ